MKIERLKIVTAHPQKQLHFYQEVLGLEILQQTQDSFQVKAGYSILEFQHQENATPYHIAFHIPAHHEKNALEWLKQRTAILKDGEDEIVDFPAWNAKSLYFYDKDQNILEFISRRHCFPAQTTVFNSGSILGISEIGLATSNVKKAYSFLNTHFHLNKITGDYEVFCATGDDEGLFIVINKDKKAWFPSNDRAFASNFEIQFTTQGRSMKMAFRNHILQLI